LDLYSNHTFGNTTQKVFEEDLFRYFRTIKKFSNDYSVKLANCVRSACKYAYENELVERDALIGARFAKDKRKPVESLTLEELERIESIDFAGLSRLEKTKNTFYFNVIQVHLLVIS
jgi:hypothetical protein